jgi:hypothetical protein
MLRKLRDPDAPSAAAPVCTHGNAGLELPFLKMRTERNVGAMHTVI